MQRIARGRAARLQVCEIRTPGPEEQAKMDLAIEEARALVAALRTEGREEEALEAQAVIENMEIAKSGYTA